jgi:hypothetical protein
MVGENQDEQRKKLLEMKEIFIKEMKESQLELKERSYPIMNAQLHWILNPASIFSSDPGKAVLDQVLFHDLLLLNKFQNNKTMIKEAFEEIGKSDVSENIYIRNVYDDHIKFSFLYQHLPDEEKQRRGIEVLQSEEYKNFASNILQNDLKKFQ